LTFPSKGNIVGVGQNTFGYHSNTGHIYVENASYRKHIHSGELINKREPFSTGDIVGVGFFRNQFFVTKNGKSFGRVVPVNKTHSIYGLYPTISFTEPGGKIIANFGNAPFSFDIRSLKPSGFIQESVVDKLLHSDSLVLILNHLVNMIYGKHTQSSTYYLYIKILVMEAINLTLVSRWWFASITGHNELWRIISFFKWPYLEKVKNRPKISWYKFYKARVSSVDRNLDCFSVVENCPLLTNGEVEKWEDKCPKLYEKFKTPPVCDHCHHTVLLKKVAETFGDECNVGIPVALDYKLYRH